MDVVVDCPVGEYSDLAPLVGDDAENTEEEETVETDKEVSITEGPGTDVAGLAVSE